MPFAALSVGWEATTQKIGRFRSEADIQRAALTETDLWYRAELPLNFSSTEI